MKGFVRSALYARVSSQKQVEELTIESQLAAVRQRVQRDQQTIDPDFEFQDCGYSGAELRRPGLERLRDTVASGLIDQVYVHSPDRLTRKLAHQALLLEEFTKHNCAVIFLNQEGIPDTPESNLLIQMQGMIAEYEREKILERTRRGRRYAAQQGKVSVFSVTPYGYRCIRKHTGDGETRWEIDATQAETVKRIFEWVGIHGYSLGRVQRELFARKICTSKGHAMWNASTLRGMLINPAYQGTAKFGKERLIPRKPGRRPKRGDPLIPRQAKVSVATSPDEQTTIPVPALITPNLFQAAGERMEENRKRQRERQSQAKHLLSGLLLCGDCGSAYCAHRFGATEYTYYRCLGGDKYRRQGKPLCPNRSLNAPRLELLIWTELCQLLRNPQRLADELARRRVESQSEPPKLLELERRVRTLRERLDRLIDAHSDGLIERAEFASRIASLRSQYHNEQARLDSLRGATQDASEDAWVAESLNRLSAQVVTGLTHADYNLKRELLKLLIQKIEIHQDEIRITYRIQSRPFVQSPDNTNRGFLQHRLLCHSTPLA